MARKAVAVAQSVAPTVAPEPTVADLMALFMSLRAELNASKTPAKTVAKVAVKAVKAKKPKVLTDHGKACEAAVTGAKSFAEALKALHTIEPVSAQYSSAKMGQHLAKAAKHLGLAIKGMPAIEPYVKKADRT